MLKKLAPLLILLAVTIGAASPLPLMAAGWWLLATTPGPPAPAVTVVSPNSGTAAGGTSVVITGTSLFGATAVSFSACGAAASYVVNGPSQITAVSPACSAQTVDIRVTTPNGVSAITGSCPTAPCDQYTSASPTAPSWVPFVGGQVASLYENFETGQYWYSGAVQASPAQSVTRTGSKVCPDFTTATANTACIGSTYGLSVSQGFTNLILQSSTYQTTPWTTGAVYDPTFATTTTAPDGTNTARLFTEDGTNNYHQVAQGFTKAGSNITYSACVYFKASTDNAFYISVDNGSPSYQGIITVFQGTNTANLTPASGWTFISSSVTASLNGFYLAQLTFTSDTTTSNRFIVGLNDNYGGFLGSYAGTAGNGLYIWGAGLYQGQTCPPAIQTTTATVSTNADVVALTSPASTLLASTNAAVQVVTQGLANDVASTIIDANGTVLLGENSSAECFTAVGATLASLSPANWVNVATCALSWVSGTSGTLTFNSFANSDSSVTRSPSGTFHLGSTSGSSAFLNGNIQSIAIYSPSVTFPVYTPVAYYFDSVAGSDTANCQSTGTACKSITKLSSLSYNGGDTINLKGGDTFVGCVIFSSSNVSNSSAAAPVTLTSYGTGVYTISTNCNGFPSRGGYVGPSSAIGTNVSGITINGGALVQNAGTGSSATWYGVGIVPGASAISGITVENISCTGGFTANGSNGNSGGCGRIFGALGSCATIDSVSFLNNTAFGQSISATDDGGFGSQNGCSATGASQGTITNLLMQGNLVYYQGGPNQSCVCGGQGNIANGVRNGTEQFDLVHDISYNAQNGGTAVGQWTTNVYGWTIKFGESYNVKPGTGSSFVTDFDGFDLDGDSQNSVVEYVYSHGNYGYGMLFWIGSFGGNGWNNNTFRYSIAENNNARTNDNSAGELTYSLSSGYGSSYTAYAYNNTIWHNSAAGSPDVAVPAFGSNWPNGYIASNIFADISGFGITSFISCDGANVASGSATIWSHNYYFTLDGGSFRAYECGGSSVSYTSLASWQAVAGGGDASSVYSATNPGLNGTPPAGNLTWVPATQAGLGTWPPATNQPTDYELASGAQPAKGAGTVLTTTGWAGGAPSRDFYGITVPGTGSCYNIGAYGGCP